MAIVTFEQKAERFPPILVRLLARDGKGKPLTNSDISGRSGLPADQIKSISYQTNWRGVDFPTMLKYLRGCGLDFDDSRSYKVATDYARRGKWRHVTRTTRERPYLLDLASIFEEWRANQLKIS